MPSTLRKNGTTAVIEAQGKLILGPEVDDFRAKWSDALATGAKHLVIILSKVPMIDSSAIGSLIRAQSAIKAVSGSMRLVGPNETILTALRVTRLDKVFEVHPDEASAVAAIAKSASA